MQVKFESSAAALQFLTIHAPAQQEQERAALLKRHEQELADMDAKWASLRGQAAAVLEQALKADPPAPAGLPTTPEARPSDAFGG